MLKENTDRSDRKVPGTLVLITVLVAIVTVVFIVGDVGMIASLIGGEYGAPQSEKFRVTTLLVFMSSLISLVGIVTTIYLISECVKSYRSP